MVVADTIHALFQQTRDIKFHDFFEYRFSGGGGFFVHLATFNQPNRNCVITCSSVEIWVPIFVYKVVSVEVLNDVFYRVMFPKPSQ